MRRLKAVIRKLPVIGNTVCWTSGALRRLCYRDTSYWLQRAVPIDNACVVQIGSNDGRTHDPIYKLLQSHTSWSALFVEPVPYLFARLKENYGDEPRFRYVKAAVNDGEKADFYWVDESAKRDIPTLPDWYDQLGSFCREHIIKHLDGVLEPYIRETEVVGIRLPDLLRQNHVSRVDILHIDAEGSDWRILSQLDLEKFAPQAILYEHKHLTPQDQQHALQFLADKYDIFLLGGDVLAVNKNVEQSVHAKLLPLRRRRVFVQPYLPSRSRCAA